MKIAVTGKNGQLGSEFQVLAKDYPAMNWTFLGSDELDIRDAVAVEHFFQQNQFDAVFNCAAYTAVDRAEEEPEAAYAVNEKGVENLAVACAAHDMKLIHFSTDYVFNGENFKPYNELDQVNPIGVYGESKLAGEHLLKQFSIDCVVIRTSWVYSGFGTNFVKTMLRLGTERDALNVVFDQVGSPTYARDLAAAAIVVLQNQKQWKPGVNLYHFSNEGVCSWYDFALAIHELKNISCDVKPILSADFPTKAKRPHFSVLDKSKIKTDFGISIRHWRAALVDMIS